MCHIDRKEGKLRRTPITTGIPLRHRPELACASNTGSKAMADWLANQGKDRRRPAGRTATLVCLFCDHPKLRGAVVAFYSLPCIFQCSHEWWGRGRNLVYRALQCRLPHVNEKRKSSSWAYLDIIDLVACFSKSPSYPVIVVNSEWQICQLLYVLGRVRIDVSLHRGWAEVRNRCLNARVLL
ncbi:hypothetical protein BJ878DRAFT_248433 [Calycina marina]|uniref:Uncharacterized protein n=1 Tax=Calycina marina TaxID=1763456 RepID=A0A9P7YW77_9HELO|nr:hypothetical protein BJ878DRAFT_248433 [Calycina marina]